MSWRVVSVAVCLAIACGSDDVANDGECKVAEPRHVLTLDPGLSVKSFGSARTRIDDRVYFVVGPLDTPVGSDDSTVVSVGPCGDDARVVAQGAHRIFKDERWPGVVLGELTGPERGVAVLDPDGNEAARLLIANASPSDEWTRFGIIALRSSATIPDASHLQLTPYPADPTSAPTEPAVLLDGVLKPSSLAVIGDTVFILTSERTLRGYDLASGAWTDVATQVESFRASDDGRWLVWRDVPPPESHEVSATYALEVGSGERTMVGPTAGWDEVGSDYLLGNGNGEYGFLAAIIDLPSGTRYELPMFWVVTHRLTTSLWLGNTFGSLFVIDRELDRLEHLSVGGSVSFAAEHLLVRESTANDQLGTVHRVDYDVLETRVVAMRATSDYRELGDGRILTRVGDEDTESRALVVVDPVSLVETPIDEGVVRISDDWWFDAEDGASAYEVERGDHREVWLARP